MDLSTLNVNDVFQLKRGMTVCIQIPATFAHRDPSASWAPVIKEIRVGQVLSNGADELLRTMRMRGMYLVTKVDDFGAYKVIYATQQSEGHQDVLGGMQVVLEAQVTPSAIAA